MGQEPAGKWVAATGERRHATGGKGRFRGRREPPAQTDDQRHAPPPDDGLTARSRGDCRGGVAQTAPDGGSRLVAGALPAGRALRPNAIAPRGDVTLLLADLGKAQGGVFALTRDGAMRPLVETADDAIASLRTPVAGHPPFHRHF